MSDLTKYSEQELNAELERRKDERRKAILAQNIELLRRIKPHREIFPHAQAEAYCYASDGKKVICIRCVLDDLDESYEGPNSKHGLFETELAALSDHVLELSLC
jgi:hypothetical protein